MKTIIEIKLQIEKEWTPLFGEIQFKFMTHESFFVIVKRRIEGREYDNEVLITSLEVNDSQFDILNSMKESLFIKFYSDHAHALLNIKNPKNNVL